MARLKREVLTAEKPSLDLVREAKSYTLIKRGPVWYVNFSKGGRQYRLSTGKAGEGDARAIVESFRTFDVPEWPCITDLHLERMLERARYRTRKKSLEFGLTRESMRALALRCKGACEVTGHKLEDVGAFRPSLDRIDPNRGYVPDNVRIVCLITNTAMLHYGEAAFLELAVTACKNRGLA